MILKNRLAVVVGAVLISIIYAAYLWIVASDQSLKLRQELDYSYQLHIDENNLQMELSAAISDINTDLLNFSSAKLLEDTEALEKFIDQNSDSHENDMKFEKSISAIAEAHRIRMEVIEDFKTSRALINNSYLWIRTQESMGLLTPEEAWMFHRIMDGFFAADLEESMPEFVPFGSLMIRRHMQILYDTVIETNRLKIKLAHSRTDGLLNQSIALLEGHLKVHERLRIAMMWSFIAGLLIALCMVIFLYWRERLSFKESRRLSNDLKQFIDALNVSNIISKTDFRGVITYVNEPFCAISGYSCEELIGSPHSIVRHSDTPSSVFKEMWKTILKGDVFKIILKNRAKDGRDYYVDTTIVPIKNEADEIVEFIAIRHDVSELVRARDEAIEAERFKDRFLSNMSHELRTPLNGIIGFSQLLERKLSDPAQRKYLKSILDSSQILLGIINNILDLSKIKSGKFTLEDHPFELYSSFLSLIDRMEIAAKEKNIDFKYELDIAKDQVVEGDWLRISQVLNNLLSNACKFTEAGGKVALKAAYQDGILECKIADSGIGMDEATIGRIFHPFEQADNSITRKFGGTGLGLSITKELVERMDGTIKLYSRVGAGSRFIITMKLPAVDIPISEEEKKDESPVRFEGDVLIVEDNEMNKMVIQLLLEEYDIRYTTATDGQSAVDLFEEGKFDLVLMDENMPNLSGIEAMQQIRRLPGGDVPIVALTANVMEGDKERFLEAGMDGFLAKPIDVHELEKVLAKYLKPYPKR